MLRRRGGFVRGREKCEPNTDRGRQQHGRNGFRYTSRPTAISRHASKLFLVAPPELDRRDHLGP